MGGVDAVGHAGHSQPAYPGNHPAQGASRTPPPTAGCETKAAACRVTGVVSSRLPNGARAVPAGFDTLVYGRKDGAPHQAWMQSVMPSGCA